MFEASFDELRLPSSQLLLEAIHADLSHRRSALVLVPEGTDGEPIWAAVRRELWRCDLMTLEIRSDQLGPGQSPEAVLSAAVGGELPAGSDLALLVQSSDLPDVLRISGLEGSPVPERRGWLTLVTRWAQLAQTAEDVALPMFFVIAPASALLPILPASNVKLAVHWWFGSPSPLEVRLLCSYRNGSQPLGRWREFLLPSLAAGDLGLLDHLWERMEGDFQDLTEALREYGRERGWTEDSLREWGADSLVSSPLQLDGALTRPPPGLSALWARGVLQWAREGGFEVHSAALAVLRRLDELRHRVWRGQSSFLLPLIDGIRLRLCSHLTDRYGARWPVRWMTPDSSEELEALQDGPFACQWGHLRRLLHECSALSRERRLLSLVQACWRARNALAHYRPIAYEDFERLWRAARKLETRSQA